MSADSMRIEELFDLQAVLAECLALERCASEGDRGSLVGLEERIEHALRVLQFTREGIRSPTLFRKARRCSNMDASA